MQNIDSDQIDKSITECNQAWHLQCIKKLRKVPYFLECWIQQNNARKLCIKHNLKEKVICR